jgi:hypothetical protein
MADWVGRTAVEIAAAISAGNARARDVVAEHLTGSAAAVPIGPAVGGLPGSVQLVAADLLRERIDGATGL